MMLCKKPFRPRGQSIPAPCGQCLFCRINRRRIWAHRMTLEAAMHKENAFVTLTYAPEHEPKDRSLVPSHVQAFIKAMRQALLPARVRFYAVGEYGDQSGRPHYHLAMFGMRSCVYGRTRRPRRGQPFTCCSECDRVHKFWGKGMVHLDELNLVTAGYVASYVTKKMTSKEDKRLKGRHPEFARMSKKPGLGYGYLEKYLLPMMLSVHGRAYMDRVQDVIASLNSNGKTQPLGRYLKDRLKVLVMRKGVILAASGHTPQSKQYLAELRALQASYLAGKETSRFAPKAELSLADIVVKHFEGNRINAERRLSLKRSKVL